MGLHTHDGFITTSSCSHGTGRRGEGCSKSLAKDRQRDETTVGAVTVSCGWEGLASRQMVASQFTDFDPGTVLCGLDGAATARSFFSNAD